MLGQRSTAGPSSPNVNSVIALVFVGSFSLGLGLVIWHAAVGNNPIADFLAQTALVNSEGK
jgi:hypothetical protein